MSPSWIKTVGTALCLAPLAWSANSLAQQDAEVRFSAPPWPGVTMKTEIASQLLEALGYAPSTKQLGSQITYEALNLGEIDAYLAAWLPAQQGMYDTVNAKGNLVDLGNNVDGARMGFAVPRYVAEAGVTSARDIDKPEFAERFNHEMFSIEPGSATSDLLNGAVDNDTYGMGDWDLNEATTPAMLSAVNSATQNDEWILFYGWTPHWMNIEYDIVYLDDPENLFGPGGGRSDVRTLLSKRFADQNPNVVQLLDQMLFTADDQSQLILEFSYKKQEASDVAIAWMRDNAEKVKTYLEGVTTRDGQPAWPVVQEAFGLPSHLGA
ncbi:ABC transporter substrate-binding protein [Halomonas sp. McH1-25]|uniref:ABC transporter substrate-binding protein n=1 Tax=unclassified Halomonas TaxID=2609666 RepID=UPI001EF50804|nr:MULTISPECIES: ABC transporter substrate-binding protein [unclassified Halomonas]MCG7599940.1 ABC transporter substrate-binding protein [Halomonas sp. McH1-25]MCP1342631.1 ABC transporter substrate-binding protein [Halomonas sp. FL8]MCP1361346.1 ABC transporter substrate-binding protein [Halomonas sp. BBD45]MCP1363842.1 ABC transporter substrate-binding protein [Halomonas sp. BBD48]